MRRRKVMTGTTVLTVLLIGGQFVPSAYAAGGSGGLDPAFSSDGRATVDFGRHTTGEEARDVVIKANGKVVTAGVVTTASTSRFALSRLKANGTPDRSFSADGKRTTGFRGAAAANRVIDLAAGKLLVAGVAGDQFALARYLANGDLDPTFGGGDGKVRTDITAGYDAVQDIRVNGDGTILAAGCAGGTLSSSPDRECPGGFATVRYLPDGSLDASFGVAGIVSTTGTVPGSGTVPHTIHDVRLQPDGKLVVAGEIGQTETRSFLIGRYDVDGAPDTSFDTDGWATIAEDGEDWVALTLLVQPNGKVLAGGYAFLGDYEYFALARLNSDGSPDLSLGGDGTVQNLVGNTFYAKAYALTRQQDGKIIAAGWTIDYADRFAISRYRPCGCLDKTFGGGDGMIRTRFDKTSGAHAYAVAVRGGKVVVAGTVSSPSTKKFAIARYRAR